MTMPPHVRLSSFISVPCDEDMFTLPPRLNIIPAVSRNPFSTAYYRAQELAFEQADAPYRIYQLACYAARPPRPPTTRRTVPATAEQRLAPKRRDGKSPWLTEADDGPRYVLVHECRMWSGPFKA
ncbi:hypothetical protein EV126DRAFT_452319 [Verticillium dahliae]|nr:hypothetical protein EV126DRAFT_452319 [Verticillium dahliae]